MENLVNGKNQKSTYVSFKAFYDEQNEAKKALIRLKMSELFNLTETSIFRKIRFKKFEESEIRDLFINLGIKYDSESGYFFANQVSIKEIENNHGLSK